MRFFLPFELFDCYRLEDNNMAAALLAAAALPPVLADAAAAALLALAALPPVLAKAAAAALLAAAAHSPVLAYAAAAAVLAGVVLSPVLANAAADALLAGAAPLPVLAEAFASALLAVVAPPPVRTRHAPIRPRVSSRRWDDGGTRAHRRKVLPGCHQRTFPGEAKTPQPSTSKALDDAADGLPRLPAHREYGGLCEHDDRENLVRDRGRVRGRG